MRKLSLLLAGVIASAFLAIHDATPAQADDLRVCSPIPAGGNPGPRRVTAESGAIYSLNARGCTTVDDGDLNWFLSQGFSIEPPFGSLVVSGVTTSSANNTFSLPAGTYIQQIVIHEQSGGTGTGKLKLGTSNGGSQICCATGLGDIPAASSIRALSDDAINIKALSATAATPVFIDTTGAFGTGAYAVTIIYGFF